MNAHLGHTRDGKPVSLWTQKNAWTGAEESFLEVGTQLVELDHIDPNLEASIKASLQREAS